MTILELDTGLFPDRATLADALNASGADVRRIPLSGPMDDAAWDAVVTAILDADTVVAL